MCVRVSVRLKGRCPNPNVAPHCCGLCFTRGPLLEMERRRESRRQYIPPASCLVPELSSRVPACSSASKARGAPRSLCSHGQILLLSLSLPALLLRFRTGVSSSSGGLLQPLSCPWEKAQSARHLQASHQRRPAKHSGAYYLTQAGIE